MRGNRKATQAKAMAAGSRAYAVESGHTHLNSAALAVINQDLATTDDVTFNSIVSTTTITATTDLIGSGSVVKFTNLPTSDPAVAGQLWVDTANSYVIKVSQG